MLLNGNEMNAAEKLSKNKMKNKTLKLVYFYETKL